MDELIRRWRDGPDHIAKLRMHRAVVANLRRNKCLVKANGVSYIVDQDDYIGHQLISNRSYEPNSINLCLKLLAGGGVFVDVGANIGLFALAIAKQTRAKVVAIEPDAANFICLEQNIRLNELDNVVRVHVAVAAEASVVRFYLPTAENRGSARITNRSDVEGSYLLSTSTIETISLAAGLDRINLLKIDVEGFELAALRGVDFLGGRRPDNILLEYLGSDAPGGPKPLGESAIYSFLVDRGYEAKTIFGSPAADMIDLPEKNAWFCASR